jgi:uncharacterized membrane protein
MLFEFIDKTVKTFLPGKRTENFSNTSDNLKYVALLITIFLWILLLLLVSKVLWNEVLCDVVTFVKPVKSVFQILGLVVLLQIISPTPTPSS